MHTWKKKAWVQVLREAGAASSHRPLLRDLAVPDVADTDSRQLDIVAGGLSIYGGRTIVGDATLRSPISSRGDAQGVAATTDGATFPGARRDKATAYPELVLPSARHKFLVLASEVGGRFSEECVNLVPQLVNNKASNLSASDSKLFRLAYTRRWWGILSMAVQRAVAANLLGGSWMPACDWCEPSEEELLTVGTIPPPDSRLR